jgi:hypothetical protein
MPRHKPIKISKFAHDRALHYLARPKTYGYTDHVRKQLIEVIEGYIGGFDEPAARNGLEWMREQERCRGETPKF